MKILETIFFSIVFSYLAKYIGKTLEYKFKNSKYYSHLIANVLVVHFVIMVIKNISQKETYARAVFVPFSFILFSVQPSLKEKLLDL